MDSSLLERANAVIAHANAKLASRLPLAFDQALSVGLNGSYARGELTAVSDLDYCLFFAEGHELLRGVDFKELVDHLQRDVRAAFPDEPLARRFSVFWSSLEDLKLGQYRVGRFPPYDRGLFKNCGQHVAGLKIEPALVRSPSPAEIRAAGVKFLLEEIRPQLDALQLFQRRDELSLTSLKQLGPVLASKAVLMPIRLLYVLMPESEARLFVGVDAAVRACARQYSTHAWWPLAEHALCWRQAFPEREVELADVAQFLGDSGLDLYISCAEKHREFALESGMSAAAEQLTAWLARLQTA